MRRPFVWFNSVGNALPTVRHYDVPADLRGSKHQSVRRGVAEPRAPPTERTVRHDGVTTATHQPEVGEFVAGIVSDQVHARAVKIKILLRPVQVVAEEDELWFGELGANRVDGSLIIVAPEQMRVADAAEVDED
jgi:hypothetical protein